MYISNIDTGLVEGVTTRTLPSGTRDIRLALRRLNQRRRVHRMRRVVVHCADATQAAPGFRLQGVFVTLTYRDSAPWRREDVSAYIEAVRMWLGRRRVPCRYQWVLELTKRGRPHYHVLFWLPMNVQLPKPDDSGQWGHGLSRIERAIRPVGYLVKYASKGWIDSGFSMPRGSRLFGCGDSDDDVRYDRHRAGLAQWLDAVATPGERVKRVAAVGFVEKRTGLIHVSPFDVRVLRDTQGFVVFVITERKANVDSHKGWDGGGSEGNEQSGEGIRIAEAIRVSSRG